MLLPDSEIRKRCLTFSETLFHHRGGLRGHTHLSGASSHGHSGRYYAKQVTVSISDHERTKATELTTPKNNDLNAQTRNRAIKLFSCHGSTFKLRKKKGVRPRSERKKNRFRKMFSQGLGVGSAILSPYFASHANVGMELRTVIGSVNFTWTGSRTRASRVRRT